jgi:SAM-dependent methyltransferase
MDEVEERNRFEWNRERVLSRIANYICTQKRTGRILDVGCATGFFLKRFFSGPDWQMWGVELSISKAKKARQRGVTVHNGTIRDAEYPQNCFDVITILDAFYYFPQPQSDLEKLRNVLGPEGMLVIELPFAKSRIWRTSGRLGRLLSGTRLPLLRTSDHLFFYDPKSLSSLLCSCGFRVRTIKQLPANRQERPLRNLIYGCYSLFSFFLSCTSGSRIILGPRFLIVAQKV